MRQRGQKRTQTVREKRVINLEERHIIIKKKKKKKSWVSSARPRDDENIRQRAEEEEAGKRIRQRHLGVQKPDPTP